MYHRLPSFLTTEITEHNYQAVDGFKVLKLLIATENNCRTDRTSRENNMIVDGHSNFENLYQGEEVVVFQPRTKTWTPAQVREEASEPHS